MPDCHDYWPGAPKQWVAPPAPRDPSDDRLPDSGPDGSAVQVREQVSASSAARPSPAWRGEWLVAMVAVAVAVGAFVLIGYAG